VPTASAAAAGSGSEDRTVKVWNGENGQEILSLKGHSGLVETVALSADGKRIVSGSGDAGGLGEVKVWDAASGQETLTLKGHTGYVLSVALSADGQRIVSGEDKTVKVWQAATDADAGQVE
jgi:WD40 repeat protein